MTALDQADLDRIRNTAPTTADALERIIAALRHEED